MKVRKYSLLVLAMLQAVATLLVPLTVALQQPAYAADPFKDVFYYPQDTDTPNAVEDLITSFNNMLDASGDPKPIMNSTYVDIQGGPFGGSPQELDYNGDGTSSDNYMDYQLNSGHGYDCYVDGSGQAQPAIPNNAVYWHIDFDMYIHRNVGTDPPTFTARERIASATKIQSPDPALEAQGGTGGGHTLIGPVTDHNADGLGSPQVSQLGIPNQCLPDPNYLSRHSSFAAIPSYYQDQADWPNITANPAGNGGGGSGVSEDTCDANSVSLGWLLCPIINLAKTAIDGIITGVIIPELQVQPLDANSGAGKNQYVIWNNIRTLADVLFVLIFLVMIFANTLQFNLNAYTIKKVIPKLVAAAILVQFSFIISAIIIDIGNILGQGVASLVGNVTIGTVNNNHQGGIGSVLDTLGAPIDILAGLGLVAVIGIPTIMVAILTALVGALGVLFTLIARRLILVILVIIAPLAFAAWVLPGTERYFNTWLKVFVRTVLMYPMIIFLLSAAAVASSAVKNGSEIENLLAAILPIIAFFMIPMTFKWAGGAMNFTAGKFNSLTNGINKSGGMKGLRTGAKERQQRINQNRAAGYQSTVFGRRVPGVRPLMTGLGRAGTGHLPFGSRARTASAIAAQKAITEEGKRLEAGNLSSSELQALATNTKKSAVTRAAAANQLAKRGNVEGLDAFRRHLNDQVRSGALGQTQATQLWAGAKAGASSEIRKKDAILAASGWQDSEYMGASLASSVAKLSGDDIAGMDEGRLQTYATAGAVLTPDQIRAATTDKARTGKTQAHQAALLHAVANSTVGAAAGAGGTPSPAQTAQLEQYMRYQLHTGGHVTARDDATVKHIRSTYNRDPTYKAQVDRAIASGMDIPPPP